MTTFAHSSESSFSEMTFSVRLDSSLIYNQIVNQLQLTIENYCEKLERDLPNWEGNFAIVEKKSGENFGDFSMKIAPPLSKSYDCKELIISEKKGINACMHNDTSNDGREYFQSSSCGQNMSPKTQAENAVRLPSVSDQRSKFHQPFKSTRKRKEDSSKMLSCGYCSFQAKTSNILITHVRTQHFVPDNQFICQLCSFSTKFKHNLKFHYQKKHNMDSLDGEFFMEKSKRRSLNDIPDLLPRLRSEKSNIFKGLATPAEHNSTVRVADIVSAVGLVENKTHLGSEMTDCRAGEFSLHEDTTAQEVFQKEKRKTCKQPIILKEQASSSSSRNDLVNEVHNRCQLETNLPTNIKIEPDIDSFNQAEEECHSVASIAFEDENLDNRENPGRSGSCSGKTYQTVSNDSRPKLKSEIPTFDDESLDKGIGNKFYQSYLEPCGTDVSNKSKSSTGNKEAKNNLIGGARINSLLDFSRADFDESEFDQRVYESDNESENNYSDGNSIDVCNVALLSQEYEARRSDDRNGKDSRKRKAVHLLSHEGATEEFKVSMLGFPKLRTDLFANFWSGMLG